MSGIQALTTPRFLRKTTLREGESNTNFKMLDNDIAEVVTSVEADRVTPLMSKIYTRLLLVPSDWRESERVLRFTGEEREGKWLTAWAQLCTHLRVSGETASKALKWMHEQGIIGYFAGKNGVGIRIFLNRAQSSIVLRERKQAQKFLGKSVNSVERGDTSPVAAPFNGSFAVEENSETDKIRCAPKTGAEKNIHDEISPFAETEISNLQGSKMPLHSTPSKHPFPIVDFPIREIVDQVRAELEPIVRRAASEAAEHEYEQTRRWFESRALPKAVRVGQRESYNVLRQYGLIRKDSIASPAEVGQCLPDEASSHKPKPRTSEEIKEIAESCLALLELQGKPIEQTLSELNESSRAYLSQEEIVRVKSLVNELLANAEDRAKICSHY